MLTIEQLTERINDRGVKINAEELNTEITMLEKAIHMSSTYLIVKVSQVLGIPVSKVKLNSSKTMVDFFYGYHELPVTRLTSVGKTPALDSDTLMPFAETNVDVKCYIQYRSDSKNLHILKNLQKEIVYGDEIHTNFNCNGAISGRFTSQAPNLQQIPSAYRKLFIPRKGFKFLCIDLKQAEPQLSYALAGVAVDEDIHTLVAKQLNIPRDKAKVFNIGVSYGMTNVGLAKVLNCSKEVAASLISTWALKNRELVDYINKVNSISAEFKEVKLYDGTTIYKDFSSSQSRDWQSNRAFNIHIQGSLAKLLKIAMVNIQNFLDEHSPNSHIVLTEHDELVIELSESSLNHVDTIVSMFENIDGFAFKSKHTVSDRWEK